MCVCLLVLTDLMRNFLSKSHNSHTHSHRQMQMQTNEFECGVWKTPRNMKPNQIVIISIVMIAINELINEKRWHHHRWFPSKRQNTTKKAKKKSHFGQHKASSKSSKQCPSVEMRETLLISNTDPLPPIHPPHQHRYIITLFRLEWLFFARNLHVAGKE